MGILFEKGPHNLIRKWGKAEKELAAVFNDNDDKSYLKDYRKSLS